MDISQLLTSFSGHTRTANSPGNSADAAVGSPARGFADTFSALQAPLGSGEFSAANATDQASLETMMRALSDGTGLLGDGLLGGSLFGESPVGESPVGVSPVEENPLAQIAKRLALIATAGDSSEAATAAVLSVEGTSLDARGDALAVATEAAGQLTAVAGEPARTPFNARSAADAASPLGLASRRASALAQLGSEPSLAANAGTETRMPGQRQSALADVLPSALAREGVVAQALSDSRLDGRGEERPEGLTGLNHAVRGSSMPAASALPAQGSLTASLYSPAWPTQLGQQLVMLGQRGGEQRVELHLNPAELGPLTISLKVSEQGAQAQFLSAHAPVRQALEQAIPQLREALAEQGISLGQTSVGEHRQQGQGDQQASAGHPGMTGPATGIDENDPVGTGTALNAPQEAGRVDLYA